MGRKIFHASSIMHGCIPDPSLTHEQAGLTKDFLEQIQLITGASAVRESGAQPKPLQIEQHTRIMLLIFGPLAEFIVSQKTSKACCLQTTKGKIVVINGHSCMCGDDRILQ